MIPGRTLHRLAARVCSARSLERIVEPAVADLQKEYLHAAAGWARAVNLATGYFSVLRVIAVCAVDMSDTTRDDRRAVMRTLGWWLGLSFAIVILLSVPWLWNYPIALKYPYLAMTLLPQVVPLAIPIGLAFGIALGLRRRVTLNASKMILICAAIASILSFATLEWAIPASNQVFRGVIVQMIRPPGLTEPGQSAPKGLSEMRLAELRHEISDAAANGENGRARRYTWAFYSRFALAAATFMLALFLLTLPVEHRFGRAALALVACIGYWMLMYFGEFAIRTRYLTPFAGAWLPNMALLVTAILVLSLRPRNHGSQGVAAP